MNQLFYTPHVENGMARLDEEESRHLLTVLRRLVGDPLQMTDGKGNFTLGASKFGVAITVTLDPQGEFIGWRFGK